MNTSAAWIPGSTYRVQLTPAFTFDDAAAIVPYLAELGVDTLYVSPIFRATPGSTHGYDVTSYADINPELGGEAGFARLRKVLLAHEFGLLVDFVPNHMGISGGRNLWWQDVLENGPASPAAAYFDIDWTPLKRELREKVLLPILGAQYGAVLEQGELRLGFAAGAFRVDYYETPLPIAPPTYPDILRPVQTILTDILPADDLDLLELGSIILALDRLAELPADTPEAIAERQREQIVAKRRLATLQEASPAVAEAVAAMVSSFNGTPGDSASFDRLDALLGRQPYRLAYWRVAGEEINYRRFFAINELAALRQEDADVFAASHALLLEILASFPRAGVRIDHPDGLWDPEGYFRDLQAAYATATGTAAAECPLYLVIEKILEYGESLPESWPVHGTVGYEFAATISNLMVNPANRGAFDELYRRFTPRRERLTDLVYEAKYLIMRTALVSEVNVLAQALNRISEEDRHTRDFTLNALRAALRETIANFPVYRTYIRADAPPDDHDRRVIDQALATAGRRNPNIDPSVLDFLRDVLLTDSTSAGTPVSDRRQRFAQRFQQLTGPVMAKGLEDTAFYRYNRLASLNEVGGNPGQFGQPVAAFHRANQERQRAWPQNLLTSSTHDTKRSEDVRARLHVLSEMPAPWRAAVNRWTRLNRRHKRRLEGRGVPDRNDEYLLYQTLLGTWPAGTTAVDATYVERVLAYTEKAAREAQIHTSWLTPNEAYEAAVADFVRAMLDPGMSDAFLTDFTGFLAPVAYHGAINGLAQQVLKLTSPGVPDLYQGTELWDFSLVDPDNRRPVDFGERRERLAVVAHEAPVEAPLDPMDAATKLLVTHRLLAWRRKHAVVFRDGDYQPLEVAGARANHVAAFRRQLVSTAQQVIVIVPRFTATLMGGQPGAPLGPPVWGDTTVQLPATLSGQPLQSVLTGERALLTADGTLHVGEALTRVPVAVFAPASD